MTETGPDADETSDELLRRADPWSSNAHNPALQSAALGTDPVCFVRDFNCHSSMSRMQEELVFVGQPRKTGQVD